MIAPKNISSKGKCKELMQIRTGCQGLGRTGQVNCIEHLNIFSLLDPLLPPFIFLSVLWGKEVKTFFHVFLKVLVANDI